MPLRPYRLSFLFAVPVLIACVATWLYVTHIKEGIAIERWSEDQVPLVRSMGHAIENELHATLSMLNLVGHDLSTLDDSDRKNQRYFLQALIDNDDAVSRAFIVSPDGTLLVNEPDSPGASAQSISVRPYFQEASKTHRAVLSERLTTIRGTAAVVADLPMLNRQGDVRFHVGAVIDLDGLSPLVTNERIAPFDNVVLLDQQYQLLAHTDSSQINKTPGLRQYFKHPLLDEKNKDDNGVRFARWQDEAGVVWLSFAYRLDHGWTILLQRKLDHVIGDYDKRVRGIKFVVIATIFLTGFFGYVLTRLISNRLIRAESTLRKTNLELEKRITERTKELTENQTQLTLSRDYYAALLENFPAMIWRSDLARCGDYFNRTWRDFTGLTHNENPIDAWEKSLHPDDLAQSLALREAAFFKREAYAMEYRLHHHDGSYHWVLDIGRPNRDLYGDFSGYLNACFDMTERHTAEEQLKLLASVFSNTHEGILIADPNLHIIDVNDAFCENTGYSREELIGKHPAFLQAKMGKKEADNKTADFWQQVSTEGKGHAELWQRRKTGEIYATLPTLSSVRDDEDHLTHYVGIFADISPIKANEKRLERLAHYDALTGLPNRTLLADRLRMAVAHAVRKKQLLAICLIDLDGFKPINDTLGHAAGDELLISFAKRLSDELRQTDTLARLGGDEFILLLSELEDHAECTEALTRMLHLISQPYVISQGEVCISASLGLTLYPEDNDGVDELMHHADLAMYRAKATGGNAFAYYSPEKDDTNI